MEVGDRVRLSAFGKERKHLFPAVNTTGTVHKPGCYRGGMRVTVLVDGDKKPRSFFRGFWEKQE